MGRSGRSLMPRSCGSASANVPSDNTNGGLADQIALGGRLEVRASAHGRLTTIAEVSRSRRALLWTEAHSRDLRALLERRADGVAAE